MIHDIYSEGFLIAAGLSPNAMNSSGADSLVSDFQLLKDWISQGTKNCQTRRVMKKEIERLIFWANAIRHKSILELTPADLANYAIFLGQPMPAAMWISKIKYPKCNDAWRPFAGPLNEASRRYALVQIGSFFKWAVQSGLLEFSPMESQEKPRIVKLMFRPRPLAQEAIAALFEVINGHGSVKKRLRDNLLLSVLLQTGLLTSEVIAADLEDVSRDENGACWIAVKGKHGELRKLAITSELFSLVGHYKTLFLSELEQKIDSPIPLILPLTGKLRRLHSSTVLAIIKKIASQAMRLLRERRQCDVAATLQRANGYMLRHSCLASMAATRNVYELKRIAGYKGLGVTEQYCYCSDNEFHKIITAWTPAICKR